MAWVYVPSESASELQGLSSVSKSRRAQRQSVLLSTSPGVGSSWHVASQTLLSGTTSAPLTLSLGLGWWIASQLGRLVKAGLRRVCDSDSPTSETSSTISYESFASYDPNGCLWKMSSGSSKRRSPDSSRSWPAWGMMRNGICFRRPKLGPRIVEEEFTYWPTPVASGYRSGVRNPRTGKWATSPILTEVAYKFSLLHKTQAGPPCALLNPPWVEWLQGLPVGWTDPSVQVDLKQWETACVHLLRRSLGMSSKVDFTNERRKTSPDPFKTVGDLEEANCPECGIILCPADECHRQDRRESFQNAWCCSCGDMYTISDEAFAEVKESADAYAAYQED